MDGQARYTNIRESELGRVTFLSCLYSKDIVAAWNNSAVINKSSFIFFSRMASVIMMSPVNEFAPQQRRDYRHIFLLFTKKRSMHVLQFIICTLIFISEFMYFEV